MIAIKSMASPTEAARGTTEMELAPVEPKILPGGNGEASDGPSLAGEHLVAKGRRSVLESIIGTHDRSRILETAVSPWRKICALEITGTNGTQFIGTGWLVGPHTLVTAGHCVNHPDMGGWAKEIVVTAGRNGAADPPPFGQVTATRFSAIDVWTSGQDPDFDYGAIHLDEDLGSKVGWFSIAAVDNADLVRRKVNISGYPATPGFGREQWFHSNGVLRMTDRRVYYDVDTTGGQSGAPVWIYRDSDGDPVVVAIHAYGTGGTPPSLNLEANSAPRIIPEVLDLIEGWIKNGK